MRFGFDCDGTLTAAPHVLGAVISALRSAGHECVVISGNPQAADIVHALDIKVDAVYNVEPGQPKGIFCRAHDVVLLVDDEQRNISAATGNGAVGLHFVAPSPSTQRSTRAGTVGGRPSRNAAVAAAFVSKIAATTTAAALAVVLRPLTISAYVAGVKSVGGTDTLGAPADAADVPEWAESAVIDNATAPATLLERLADVLPYAQNIFAGDQSPDQVADTVSANAATDGAEDGMTSLGFTQYSFDAEPNSCQECQDAEDGGPYDLDDENAPRPALHGSCSCSTSGYVDDTAARSSLLARELLRLDLDHDARMHERNRAAFVRSLTRRATR